MFIKGTRTEVRQRSPPQKTVSLTKVYILGSKVGLMFSRLRTSLFTRVSSSISLSWFSTVSSPNQLRTMTPKDLVEKAITDNQIAIFSKSYCPFCKRAKALLKEKFPDAKSVIYELDEMDDGTDIQNYLHTKTGQRTVPNIFVGQEHIGGCDDTFAAEKAGRIATLLQ
ncbi:hypothetical protein D9756_006209 [Leucocoprinus leucothites]|uniref:glutathione peroxidase n=1 Tax=Leucocoprinus leucothites TaxID=201217 RepID=A0A8H5D3E7_9AGAR|nr:hypothetical protein D9756_006209 [Leucoagaricus leucothites]